MRTWICSGTCSQYSMNQCWPPFRQWKTFCAFSKSDQFGMSLRANGQHAVVGSNTNSWQLLAARIDINLGMTHQYNWLSKRFHSVSTILIDLNLLLSHTEIAKVQQCGRIPLKEQKYVDIYREKQIRVTVKVLVPVKEHPKVNWKKVVLRWILIFKGWLNFISSFPFVSLILLANCLDRREIQWKDCKRRQCVKWLY